MAGIKQKTGICIDCYSDWEGEGSHQGKEPKIVPLIAKRCKGHYWKENARVNALKPKNKAKNQVKKVVGAYLAKDAIPFPKYCEETGVPLPQSPLWMRMSCKAHILAKNANNGFPSVAIHPKNMIFLHPDIHANMDRLGEKYILNMKSLPVMKARVQELIPFMPPKEVKRIPHYFL